MTRGDTIALVTRLVRDQSGLIMETDVAAALDLAVLRYNADRDMDCILSEDENTLPQRHHHAVASWAAGILFDQLAAHHSGTSEPTLQADTIDYASKSRDYAARAKQARTVYYDALGLTPGTPAPACAVVNWSRNPSGGPVGGAPPEGKSTS